MAERLRYLQEFSRRERNRHIPVDLNALLAAFYEDNRPDVELSGQILRLDLPLARLTVLGDGDRLRLALENLCYNAVSFTPEDGGISLTLRREGAMAVPASLRRTCPGCSTGASAAGRAAEARGWASSSSAPWRRSTAARWRRPRLPAAGRYLPSACPC